MPDGRVAPDSLIVVQGVSKAYGAVQALRDVDIEFQRGKVHGLVGANGAGKSTLLNVLGGTVHPDTGTVTVDGEAVQVANPREAAKLGFAFISQELALVPEFSAIENMTLPLRGETFLGLRDHKPRRQVAREVAARLDLRFDLDQPVRRLPVAERGLVAIGRALVRDARFVSMDEPTAALSASECERLFGVVRDLAASGVAIAYVSHRLEEIEDLCDSVSVFKDGQIVAKFARAEYARDDLIVGITGGFLSTAAATSTPPVAGAAEPVLEVRGLQRPPRVHDVSFTLHPGEILGLAGVVGAGRSEVARLIFGADRLVDGAMELRGRPFKPRSVADAITRGVALVPEERRSQALVMEDSITANVAMGNWRAFRLLRRLPLISDRRARSRADDMISLLSVKARSGNDVVRTLSGGNQQKVVLGRWLSRNATVLLLDEPTRGVDVGARAQIWEAVEAYAAAGNSVLVICSELDELTVCHRVVVVVEGRTVAELQGPGVTEEQMNEAIYSAAAATVPA